MLKQQLLQEKLRLLEQMRTATQQMSALAQNIEQHEDPERVLTLMTQRSLLMDKIDRIDEKWRAANQKDARSSEDVLALQARIHVLVEQIIQMDEKSRTLLSAYTELLAKNLQTTKRDLQTMKTYGSDTYAIPGATFDTQK